MRVVRTLLLGTRASYTQEEMNNEISVEEEIFGKFTTRCAGLKTNSHILISQVDGFGRRARVGIVDFSQPSHLPSPFLKFVGMQVLVPPKILCSPRK